MSEESAEDKGSVCPQFFNGPFVRVGAGEVAASAVSSNKLIGVLFAGSWCAPSRQFVSLLVDGYHEIRKEHGDNAWEVVLVPREKTQHDWLDLFFKMPWLSVPWAHPLVLSLKEHFAVTKVPRLVVLDFHGAVVCSDARGGQGFGFGCDPLQAYVWLMRCSGQELRQRPVPPPIATADRAAEDEDEDSEDDDDDSESDLQDELEREV